MDEDWTAIEARERVAQLEKHVHQVAEGLTAAGSPPDFLLPEGANALNDRGLPWWFGSDFRPTKEALEEFRKPI